MKVYSSKLPWGKYLHCFSVKDQEDQSAGTIMELDRVHNVLLIDRSGSMGGEIDGLIDNIIVAINEMREQDIISIIWFSGVGQNGFIVRSKGLYEQDKKDIVALLNSKRSTVGATCFSETFAELRNLIEDESCVCKNFNVLFFTDGQPVVSWGDTEEFARVGRIVEEIKSKILGITSIGYGFYYDVDFLKNVAETTTFGKYFHSKNINEYVDIFRNVYEIAKTVSLEKAKVEAPGSEILYLSENFTKLFVNSCEVNLNRRKNQFFVISDSETPEIRVNDEAVSLTKNTKMTEATLTNFGYSYASELFYKGSVFEAAISIVNLTRDKNFIDQINSAFTYQERADVTENIKKAVLGSGYKKKRLVSGECSANYLPREDEFCFVDLLEILQSSDSLYSPMPKSEYKRIGLKSVDTFDLFEYSDDVAYSSFNNLVYNKSHANISILINYPGTVKLNAKEAKKLGLDQIFPGCKVNSYVYRNQTLIKDANKNGNYFYAFLKSDGLEAVERAAVNSGRFTIDRLGGKTPDDSYTYVRLNLADLPVINRLYLKKANDLSFVTDLCVRQNELAVQQKVLKYLINKIEEERPATQKKSAFEGMTVDQIECLKNHGLDENLCYNGVGREVVPSEDFYITRSLDFDIAGWSSIPAIDDSLGKKAAGKKLTDKDEAVIKTYDIFEKAGQTVATKANLILLEEALSTVKREIRTNNNTLANIRIAKIATNTWWNDLIVESSRGKDNFTFTKDANKLVIKTDRVKKFY
jgi:hypothetical protein